MNPTLDLPDGDVLGLWAATRTRRVCHHGRMLESGLRFAFYGRVSTQEYQDPVSSRRWQLDFAAELVAGRGPVVAQYFDVGYSREIAWTDRPEAARLLAAIIDPDRGFDAIVVGEYARAFHGSQAIHLAPLLHAHGVQLWLPEVDGPVDLTHPTHQALLMLLGAQAKQEVQRARFRTTAAMQAQAREQGRHLGGRPPYGYRLVDAGPHPNSAHAAWGRRLHRLAPDPETAPWVRWIFTRRLEGHSIARIARMLNETGVPCPSAVDRDRNPHRPGEAWHLRTVATILANPRYTGRQVWNRQRTHPRRTDDVVPGVTGLRKLTPSRQWAISDKAAHEALVSESDFVAVQAVSARRRPPDGARRSYLLVGLLRCGTCGRSMESQLSHGNPAYRCRHGRTSAHPTSTRQEPNLYLREDIILARIFVQLHTVTSRDAAILEKIAGLQQNPNAAGLVSFLRAHNLTIECRTTNISLEPDHERSIIIRPASHSPERQVRIPRQRGQQQTQKLGIVNN
ncbi:recombinase-like zinc beta ribbon protein [Krasilnikovia cinnamomea]|uniref:Recombinase-like zinc beta ribbon protein n=1 Tax=Krasilnikovia cinnamomea TaxID=349313 RepID=A0A4Q7ZRU0_9ACTN|nr:recombinase family protein [Krasilnikovia cinnamomea]RZU53215.1 recombinase-like zinc beta ribbon protein [Krasilnikovia cinnamomea]